MAYGTVNADVIGTSVAGSNLGAGNASIMKNRIINGAMPIDQRNAGASVSGNGYPVDRWQVPVSQSSKLTAQQNAGSVTPPVGFTNYVGVTSSSAYSVISSDYFLLGQRIEGFNWADLGWGSANAKTVTLSFWVYSSLTGTFGGSLQNSAQTRTYPYSYTISSANTWEYKTVTITGDTTGTWLTTNGVGVTLWFSLGVGSSNTGTAGAWAAGAYLAPTGATSVVGTSGATFYITGVQLEVGSSATGFEYRQYQQELALCQRYAASTFPIGTAWGQAAGASGCVLLGSVGAGAGYGNQLSWRFPVTMRTTPTTITTYNPVAANANGRNFAATADRGVSALNFSQNSMNSITFTLDGTGDTVGQALGIHYSVSAEL